MPYYRTRSLPNFETTSLYKNAENLKPEKGSKKGEANTTIMSNSECVCQKAEICLPNLNNAGCKVMSCEKSYGKSPLSLHHSKATQTTTTRRTRLVIR